MMQKASAKRTRLGDACRIVLGMFEGMIVRHKNPGHVFVIAPTGSGKTTCTVIPTLLEWPGSAIIHDPKEEIWETTGGWRGQQGQAYRLHPLSEETHCYDPVANIRWGTPYEIRDVQIFGDILTDPDGTAGREEARRGGSSAHFRQIGTDLANGLIVYGYKSGEATTLPALYKLTNHYEWEALLLGMGSLEHLEHPIIQRAVTVGRETKDRELSGVVNNMRRAFRLFADPMLEPMLSSSDFTATDLKKSPTSVYLSIPFPDQQRLLPLTRLITRQLIEACIAREHLNTDGIPVLGMIDELPALGYFPIIKRLLSYGRGYGITLCLITPSIAELGDEQEVRGYIESSKYQVIYTPNDPAIARFFSAKIGNLLRPKVRTSVSREPFSVLWDRKTTSHDEVDLPLSSPTDITYMGKEAVLLMYEHGYPALLKKHPYYQDVIWKSRSAIAPTIRKGKE